MFKSALLCFMIISYTIIKLIQKNLVVVIVMYCTLWLNLGFPEFMIFLETWKLCFLLPFDRVTVCYSAAYII